MGKNTDENYELNKVVHDTEAVNDISCDDMTEDGMPNLTPNPNIL